VTASKQDYQHKEQMPQKQPSQCHKIKWSCMMQKLTHRQSCCAARPW